MAQLWQPRNEIVFRWINPLILVIKRAHGLDSLTDAYRYGKISKADFLNKAQELLIDIEGATLDLSFELEKLTTEPIKENAMTAQNLNTVEGAPPLPLYKSHKQVRAAKIKEVYDAGPENGETVIVFEDDQFERHIYSKQELQDRPKPQAGMYLVQYEQDGYISFSPAEAFEAGYTREDSEQDRGTFVADEAFAGEVSGQSVEGSHGIGWAVDQLHSGKLVRRSGWNGKGMFLLLVPGSTFEVNRPPLLGVFPEGTSVDYHAHVDMKTAQGYLVPWLASQADLLAEDWELAFGGRQAER